MPDLQIRPAGYALGAVITGVDLREELDDETFASIRQASLDYLLLCFPEQHLEREQFAAFAHRCGNLDDNATVKHRDPENTYITMLTNKPFAGKPFEGYKNGENWHSDRSYRENPTPETFLLAKEIPEVGGDTIFSNQYLAYDSLSAGMRKLVDGLNGVHKQAPEAARIVHKEFPAVVHPIAKVHPGTGRKALYIGEHLVKFEGWTEEESRPLIDFLGRHAINYEFTYRHRWHVNDLVTWDNRALLHIALKDYDLKRHPRHIWKISVRGAKTGELLTV